MKVQNKKIILFSIISIMIISLCILFAKNSNSLNNFSNRRNNGYSNAFAIYTNGMGVSDIPPSNGYYIFDKASCTNGATATWDEDNWNITINFDAKTKCSLYFKNKVLLRGNASEILNIFSDYTTPEIIDLKMNDKLAFDGTVDNNLRYMGQDPDNYVMFNNELWRIIGIFNNIENSTGQKQTLLKLKRKDSLGEYAWDTSDSSINNGWGVNQWGESTYEDGTPYEGSDLMRELNTDYLGNITVGTDGKWYYNTNNAKTRDMPTTTISTEAQAMMETVVWNLGTPDVDEGSYTNGLNYTSFYKIYEKEREPWPGFVNIYCINSPCGDGIVRTSTWTGKVGLIYTSDLYFSAIIGGTLSRAECLNMRMIDFGSDKCTRIYSWVNNPSWYQWHMTPSASGESEIFIDGNYTPQSIGGYRPIGPVVYLKHDISIVSGKGTADDPYILSNTTTT